MNIMIVDGKKMKTDTQKKAGVLRHLQDLFYTRCTWHSSCGDCRESKGTGFYEFSHKLFSRHKIFFTKKKTTNKRCILHIKNPMAWMVGKTKMASTFSWLWSHCWVRQSEEHACIQLVGRKRSCRMSSVSF